MQILLRIYLIFLTYIFLSLKLLSKFERIHTIQEFNMYKINIDRIYIYDK